LEGSAPFWLSVPHLTNSFDVKNPSLWAGPSAIALPALGFPAQTPYMKKSVLDQIVREI
jgi:hypothetical protein